ncbi:MAG: N-acetylglucosamine-6-phosphate deacetylase [Dermatophilaceae bacterium]
MRGLVDIHCHGAFGGEFGTTDAASRMASAHHKRAGVDRVVASLVSAAPWDLTRQIGVLAPLIVDRSLAGIHLEGPFISYLRRGAHDARVLRDPDPALVSLLADVAASNGAPGGIRQLTFAPELPGAQALVQACVAHGIRPAVGHTDADAGTVARSLADIAQRQGAPALVTHLFNGMAGFHHRSGGPVAAALAAAGRGDAVVELVADGTHVSADVVRMVFETVGPDAVALVSDATTGTGLGDGHYVLGSLRVKVEHGVARTADTGSIAGSTSTLADCVRWAIEVAGVNADDACRAASVTPARALGLAT